MKQYTIIQTYELEVSVTVNVPDDLPVHEVQEYFSEFPISVVVESAWENSDNDEVTCNNDIVVESLTVHGNPLVYDADALMGNGTIVS